MATIRALSHLQALVELTERADVQIEALGRTLHGIVEQIDAVVADADISVHDVLTESALGTEVAFSLSHTPVKPGSVIVRVNGSVVSASLYAIDANAGTVTPTTTLPAKAKVEATYTVLGLASQVTQILAVLPNLSAQMFLDARARYQTAIAWIAAREQ